MTTDHNALEDGTEAVTVSWDGTQAVTVGFRCSNCGRFTVRKSQLGADIPKICSLHDEAA